MVSLAGKSRDVLNHEFIGVSGVGSRKTDFAALTAASRFHRQYLDNHLGVPRTTEHEVTECLRRAGDYTAMATCRQALQRRSEPYCLERVSSARRADMRHTAREVRRMTEGSKQTGEDHEVWLKCFVATLSGATGTTTTGSDVRPEDVASICAAIADAAVKEERQRRPEVKWPR